MEQSVRDENFYAGILPPTVSFPPVPDAPSYLPVKLEFLPVMTRAEVKDAPIFDPEKPSKNWTVTLPEGVETFRYLYFDRDEIAPVKVGEMTRAQAAALNLTGKPVFAKYVVAPTPAVVVGGSSDYEKPISPLELATLDQAQSLAAELGAVEIQSVEISNPVFSTEWRGEVRRPYYIRVGGTWQNVGVLLDERHRSGVNAPGWWEVKSLGVRWLSAALPDGHSGITKIEPAPVRPLKPFEEVASGGGFGGAVVFRTDRESEYTRKWRERQQAASGGASAPELAQISATLAQVARQVDELHRMMISVSPR